MQRITLDSVKDCECIHANNSFVILCGKNPWIFRRDGTFVTKLQTIRHAYEMVFLSENTALINGSGDKHYHYVSLCDGQIIWSYPKKGRRDYYSNPLVATPDGQTVFCVYYMNSSLFVDVIKPKKESCNSYPIPLGLRATYDSYCDAEGNLYLLQSYLTNEPSTYEDEDQSYSVYGVLKWSPDMPEPVWVHQWDRKPNTGYIAEMCNDEFVLFDDFTVASFKTGEVFSLLENEPEHKRTPGGFACVYDRGRSFLTVTFTSSWSTVIIDCQARKIVAHYAPITPGLCYGCLIGDEFWIGTSKGVVKRPFPHMDDFPWRL